MSNLTVKGNASGTGTIILESPNTNSNRTITLPDATATLASTAYVDSSVATAARMVAGTAVSSTSGTAIDFTGIPSWAKRVTVMLSGVSFNATPGQLRLQLGDSGGIEDSGYDMNTMSTSGGFASVTNLSGSNLVAVIMGGVSLSMDATTTFSGSVILTNVSGNTWAIQGFISTNGTGACSTAFGGAKTLSSTLDRVRVTVQLTGASAFDAGTINILYEG